MSVRHNFQVGDRVSYIRWKNTAELFGVVIAIDGKDVTVKFPDLDKAHHYSYWELEHVTADTMGRMLAS